VGRDRGFVTIRSTAGPRPPRWCSRLWCNSSTCATCSATP